MHPIHYQRNPPPGSAIKSSCRVSAGHYCPFFDGFRRFHRDGGAGRVAGMPTQNSVSDSRLLVSRRSMHPLHGPESGRTDGQRGTIPLMRGVSRGSGLETGTPLVTRARLGRSPRLSSAACSSLVPALRILRINWRPRSTRRPAWIRRTRRVRFQLARARSPPSVHHAVSAWWLPARCKSTRPHWH